MRPRPPNVPLARRQPRRRARAALALGVLLAFTAPLSAQSAPPSDPRLEQACTAIEAGQFARARALLEPRLPETPQPVTTEAARLAEIMRRIRLDYALTAAQMHARLQRTIPDVTPADVAAWTHADLLQHRVIDGQTFYFNREPSNLLRFCDAAHARWVAAHDGQAQQPDTWRFPLVDHVAGLIQRAAQTTDPEIYPVRHQITYTITIPADHPRHKPGATVRAWLPYPQEVRQQTDVKLIRSDPPHNHIAPNATPHRTIYFEQKITAADTPTRFTATFSFVTRAVCPDLDPARAQPADPDDPDLRPYLTARPPHIPLDDDVRALAAKIVGDEQNPLARAHRIFHWVDAHIAYCAEMEYSTIPSLARKALASHRGDCGVQAMTFITLCRAAGIPARWQSGWATLPVDWNMHDWAEFHVAPWGWLPADPSYGLLEHDDPRVREFYCGHLDAYRLIVNRDYARDLVPPKTSFRSEPNDFQRGEVEIDGFNLYFDEWDWDIRIETTPPSASPTTRPAGP
jgi:transglutaminase-like putative cysteine protease